MTKRRKASIIVTGKKRAFQDHRRIVNILTGTFNTNCTQKGVICISGSAAGAATGNCYISIDTAGTGTKINA